MSTRCRAIEVAAFTRWARSSRSSGRARGLTRLVGLVAWWNTPARHVMEGKTGRTVVGSIGYWTVGLGRRYFARGGVRLEGDAIVIAEHSVGSHRPGAAFPS